VVERANSWLNDFGRLAGLDSKMGAVRWVGSQAAGSRMTR
jgi:hypothetical protein